MPSADYCIRYNPFVPTRAASDRFNLASWLVLAIAIALHIVAYVSFARANAPTYDEGIHLAAGYRIWQCGNFAFNPEHPPLAKILAAAPLRNWQLAPLPAASCRATVADKLDSFKTAFFLDNGPNAATMIFKARLPLMVFSLLLLVLLFVSVREWFGPVAASIAALLFVFEPSLTAHAVPVTTDMPLTALMFASVCCAWLWLKRPSWLPTLLLGLVLGLTLAAKHSGVLVPFMVLAVMLFCRKGGGDRPAHSYSSIFSYWTAASTISIVILWAFYGFRFFAAPAANAPVYAFPRSALLDFFFRHHLLPEAYLTGLADILGGSAPLFLLGRFHPTGVWYYFPIAISIKTTLPLLILIVAAVVLARRLWAANSRAVLLLAIPALFYLAVAMTSRLDIGIRHVLPIYPFLIALAAAAAARLAKRSRATAVVVVALLAWQCVSFAASAPYHLSYANEAYGGRDNLYRSMAVDWGESAYLVTEWSQRHQATPCFLVWFTPTMPRTSCALGSNFANDLFDLAPPLPPERFRGNVLISTIAYQSQDLPYRATFPMKPSEVIEGSVLVFSGDFDFARITAFQHLLRARWALRHGQSLLAVDECAAVNPALVDPVTFNLIYGAALAAVHRDAEAMPKLQAAYDLASRDPRLAALRDAAARLLRQLRSTL